MHALLLTLLTLPGADASAMAGGGSAPGYYAEEGAYCDEGGACRGHCHGHNGCGICGPMPQSCYNPSFGCYPSTRFMHRYPAFHGTYYRAAYNYRNYFDYPWHAGLHEPTSHFSYHVPGEGNVQEVPTPMPAAARPGAAPSGVRSASVLKPEPIGTGARR